MSPIRYQCSNCGYVMNEPHGTCPSCKAILGARFAPLKIVKPYTKANFIGDLIGSTIILVGIGMGFFFWLPGRTGTVNDSGPIFLLGIGAMVGLVWFISAFDRRASEAKKGNKEE